MDMAKHPGLMARGRRWYLRAKVPIDLIAFLGRSEVWRSLHTGDHREAVKRFLRARADLDAWFDAQRARRDVGEKLNGEVPRLVTAWFHQAERKAAHRDFALTGELLRMALDEVEQELHELLDGGADDDVSTTIDRVLIQSGWPAKARTIGAIKTRVKVADGEVPAALPELARRALIEAARRRLDRLTGRPGTAYDPLFNGPVPASVPSLKPGANGQNHGLPPAEHDLTVGGLIERFRAEKEPAQSAKLRSDYSMLYEVLAALWGEAKPARSINRQHCRQVRDLFAALPANPRRGSPG
jgi:hypothetical protein